MTPLPQLPKTAAAIEAYDAFDAATNWDTQDTDEWFKADQQLDRLGESVGAAFGEETKDRTGARGRALIRPEGGRAVQGAACRPSAVIRQR